MGNRSDTSAWRKFIAGFGYAFEGIWYGLRTQRNLRIHVVIAGIAVLLSFLLRLSLAEFALILLTIALVIAAELVNTSIECCIDLVSPEHHPLAKRAKDSAAGAVLVCALLAVIIGCLLFGPRLWNLMIQQRVF
uniref:Diacylglycerol kinase n=1 Tax=Thermosporothrix sp. COM3 TaxID=2490863 RepID=A0A455SLH0_9CHLR|nr:diacylglycerol kinase [Thermosporothrix sp. COM3]